jgi:DNA-binding GntR family transcriptional regulator
MLIADKNQVEPTNKKENAYQIIKSRIINNEYKPMDTLTEQSICNELGVSKTPVREAFKDLEKEGFVKIIPSIGCLVSSIGLDYIHEIFEIREILECAAVRIVAERSERAPFEKLLNNHISFELAEQKNIKGSLVSGYEIHTAIFEALGNSRMLNFYKNIQSHIIRIRLYFLHQFDLNKTENMNEEHRAILKFIIAGNPEKAEQSMRIHLRNSQERIKSLL